MGLYVDEVCGSCSIYICSVHQLRDDVFWSYSCEVGNFGVVVENEGASTSWVSGRV